MGRLSLNTYKVFYFLILINAYHYLKNIAGEFSFAIFLVRPALVHLSTKTGHKILNFVPDRSTSVTVLR